MDELSKNTTRVLNNGLQIPALGFGVWRVEEGETVENAVKWALEAGYRLVDTATAYKNEGGVGKALAASGVPREEIFLTTKLWNEDQGYETTLAAFDASLQRLGVAYVDLYLVHWPFSLPPADIHGKPPEKRAETWRAMEEIYKSGRAKAIGVSNYTIRHLEEMKNYATVMPTVNQVEFNPFLYQKEMLEYCTQHGILVEAYSPLVHGEKLADPRIGAIAQKYGKSNAQIFIRWSMQHGCVPLPKSTHQERIQENFNVFDFDLSAEDMEALDALNENLHMRADPNVLDGQE